MRVERVDGDWLRENIETLSHAVFNEVRSSEIDRCQFGLMAYKDKEPIAYVTCIEFDSETLYWQIGGTFENIRGGFSVVPCFLHMVDWSLKNYKRITMRVNNENVRMLNLAMRIGFRICGTWNFNNMIFLELLMEGKNGEH